MDENQSGNIGREAQLVVLWQHKWRAEIEQAIGNVKLGVYPARKRTKMNKSFRRQWYRAMERDRRAGMRFSHSRMASL